MVGEVWHVIREAIYAWVGAKVIFAAVLFLIAAVSYLCPATWQRRSVDDHDDRFRVIPISLTNSLSVLAAGN